MCFELSGGSATCNSIVSAFSEIPRGKNFAGKQVDFLSSAICLSPSFTNNPPIFQLLVSSGFVFLTLGWTSGGKRAVVLQGANHKLPQSLDTLVTILPR